MLDAQFYAEHLCVPVARWAVVWLLGQPEITSSIDRVVAKAGATDPTLATREAVVAQLITYLTADADAAAFQRAAELLRDYFFSIDEAGARDTAAVKLLNLARAWVTQLLPHCWKMIHRVGFGLLRASDPQRPMEPLNRKLLAVPFVGKVGPQTTKRKR